MFDDAVGQAMPSIPFLFSKIGAEVFVEMLATRARPLLCCKYDVQQSRDARLISFLCINKTLFLIIYPLS